MRIAIASLRVAAVVRRPFRRAQAVRQAQALSRSRRGPELVAGLVSGVTTAATGLVLGVVLLACGCGNRAQQQAYERAVQAEQHLTVENAPALIADYRRVRALQPNTAWARQAGERIAAVEARVKAEELHKSVFQEHGVD